VALGYHLVFRIDATPEYYKKRYDYPLLIWLHSQDSSEYGLGSVMPHLGQATASRLLLAHCKNKSLLNERFVERNLTTSRINRSHF
jgi:hypothetical protein